MHTAHDPCALVFRFPGSHGQPALIHEWQRSVKSSYSHFARLYEEPMPWKRFRLYYNAQSTFLRKVEEGTGSRFFAPASVADELRQPQHRLARRDLPGAVAWEANTTTAHWSVLIILSRGYDVYKESTSMHMISCSVPTRLEAER